MNFFPARNKIQLLSIISLITLATANSATNITQQQNLAREILTNLKNDIVPPSIKAAVNILKTESALEPKFRKALGEILALSGLPYLMMRSDIATLLGGAHVVPLTTYKDGDHLDVKGMAETMNLKPEDIDIAECDIKQVGPKLPQKRSKKVSFSLVKS